MDDKELVISPAEMQPVYDILVRLTIATERCATALELTASINERTQELTSGLMLDTGAAFKNMLGGVVEDE